MLKYLKTWERSIAVTGTAFAGKTVFLLSLLNHLRCYRWDRFRLGGGKTNLQRFRELPARDGAHRFAYEKHRATLLAAQGGAWPARTTEISEFHCEVERTDWTFPRLRLHVFDFPGDRCADVLIANLPDHAAWSDRILDHLQCNREYREGAQPFLDSLEAGATGPVLLKAWKLALARHTFAYLPVICPSTFLLDHHDPALPAGSTPEEMAGLRYSGFSPAGPGGEAREFAPLSAAVRTRQPDLARAFAAHYTAYRNEIVLPLFERFNACHRLIVLIDIPSILAGGVGRLNDTRRLLHEMSAVISGRSLLSLLLSPLYDLGGIEKVAYAATKTDLIHPDDRETRLVTLLEDLVKPARDQLRDGIAARPFCCASCVATRAGGEAQTLVAIPSRDNECHAPCRIRVPALPAGGWPADYRFGDFPFGRVEPEPLVDEGTPPRQIGVNDIFDWIIA